MTHTKLGASKKAPLHDGDAASTSPFNVSASSPARLSTTVKKAPHVDPHKAALALLIATKPVSALLRFVQPKPVSTLLSDEATASSARASATVKKAPSFHLHKANLARLIPPFETSSETVCLDHNPSVFEVVENSSKSNFFDGVLRMMGFITKLVTQVAPKGISKLRKPKCLLSQGNVISGRYSGFLMFIMMTVFCVAGGEQDFVPNTNYGKDNTKDKPQSSSDRDATKFDSDGIHLVDGIHADMKDIKGKEWRLKRVSLHLRHGKEREAKHSDGMKRGEVVDVSQDTHVVIGGIDSSIITSPFELETRLFEQEDSLQLQRKKDKRNGNSNVSPNRADFCSDVECIAESSDEMNCQSYYADNDAGHTPNIVEPSDRTTSIACFCCSKDEAEPTNNCTTTAGKLKRVVQNYKDDMEVILVYDLLEEKMEQAFPDCSTEEIQEVLMNDTVITQEIEELIEKAKTRYQEKRIHDAIISIEHELEEEEIEFEDALEHIAMDEQQIDILLENYGKKPDKDRVRRGKSAKARRLKAKAERIRGRFKKNYDDREGQTRGNKNKHKPPKIIKKNASRNGRAHGKEDTHGPPKIIKKSADRKGRAYDKDDKHRLEKYSLRYENPHSTYIKAKAKQEQKGSRRLIQSEFTRFTDHVQTLKKSIPMNSAFFVNRIGVEIGNCTSNLGCSAIELEDIAEKLEPVLPSVLLALAPLEVTLGNVDRLGSVLQAGEMVLSTIILSLTVLQKMPGFLGPIFEIIYNLVRPIGKLFEKVIRNASDFIQKISGKWADAMEKLIPIIESVGIAMVSAAGATSFAAEFAESTCAKQASKALIGTDMFKHIEDVAPVFLVFAKSFKDAIFSLSKALVSDVWETTQQTLESIVEVSTGIAAALNPLEPLQRLMETEIVIPWIEFPYKIVKVGASHCSSSSVVGYSSYKGTVSWDTCWENTPSHWHIPILDPYSVKKNCNSPDLNQGTHLLGKCYNKHYSRGKYWPRHNEFGWCDGGWWPDYPCHKTRCSNKFGSGWYRYWDQIHCAKECPWYKYESNLHCYDKTCPRDYTVAESGKFCIGRKRSIRNHKTICTNYQSADGIPIGPSAGWEGPGCYQQCKSGLTEVLGFCVQTGANYELRISAMDIINAFKDIIDFISGLPIVKIILDGIDAVMRPIFGFVEDLIEGTLANLGIDFPEFPSISLDMLPFPELDLPELPDLSAITDISATIKQLVTSKIPRLPPPFEECDHFDSSCMLEKIPIINTIMESSGNIASLIENIQSDLMNTVSFLMSTLNCTKEENLTIPVGQIARDTLGIDLETSCDTQIAYCSEVDFGSTEMMDDIITELRYVLNPVMDKFLNMLNTTNISATKRRLNALKIPMPSKIPLIELWWDIGPPEKRSNTTLSGKSISVKKSSKENHVTKDDSTLDIQATTTIIRPGTIFKLKFDYDWQRPFPEALGMQIGIAWGNKAWEEISMSLTALITRGLGVGWGNSPGPMSIWNKGEGLCFGKEKKAMVGYSGRVYSSPIYTVAPKSLWKTAPFTVNYDNACWESLINAHRILFATNPKATKCNLDNMEKEVKKHTKEDLEYSEKCISYWTPRFDSIDKMVLKWNRFLHRQNILPFDERDIMNVGRSIVGTALHLSSRNNIWDEGTKLHCFNTEKKGRKRYEIFDVFQKAPPILTPDNKEVFTSTLEETICKGRIYHALDMMLDISRRLRSHEPWIMNKGKGNKQHCKSIRDLKVFLKHKVGKEWHNYEYQKNNEIKEHACLVHGLEEIRKDLNRVIAIIHPRKFVANKLRRDLEVKEIFPVDSVTGSDGKATNMAVSQNHDTEKKYSFFSQLQHNLNLTGFTKAPKIMIDVMPWMNLKCKGGQGHLIKLGVKRGNLVWTLSLLDRMAFLPGNNLTEQIFCAASPGIAPINIEWPDFGLSENNATTYSFTLNLDLRMFPLDQFFTTNPFDEESLLPESEEVS